MQTSDVKETAQNALHQSKSFISKQVDDRSTILGAQIGSVAGDLRDVGDQLRQNGAGSVVADYVEQGAELVDGLGRYLQDADSETLLADLEKYARGQPWALAAGALVLGFAAARFLKTSSARRYRAASGSDRGGTYGNAAAYGGSSTYGETSFADGPRTDPQRSRSGGERYAP